MEFYSKLDQKILQQAIRDIASKNPKTSTEALRYFTSDDFKKTMRKKQHRLRPSNRCNQATKHLSDNIQKEIS